MNKVIPEKIFIVPYRDRAPQRMAFIHIMSWILEGQNYRILFIHQKDTRPFNRGAIKNIGFIYVRDTYPNNYRNITLIFHDIDHISWRRGQFSFTTQPGVITHHLGFERSLGGIFSIKAGDFEKINGFPNIWTWGLEDNILYNRSRQAGLKVDGRRRLMVQDDMKDIIGLWHGWDRLINPNIHNKMVYDRTHGRQDGIRCLRNVRYTEKADDKDKISMIDVYSFTTNESLNSPFVKGAKMADARYYKSFKDKHLYRRQKKSRFFNFGRPSNVRR